MGQSGIMLVGIGILSFFLPPLGFQFRLINLFGSSAYEGGIILIGVGSTLVVVDLMRGRLAGKAGRPANDAASPPRFPPPAPPELRAKPRSGQVKPRNTPEARARFCGQCGQPIRVPTDSFCRSCGVRIG